MRKRAFLQTRREFLKTTSRVAAASALASMAIPPVHPGEDNTFRLALVGCGGRGTGAVGDAFSVPGVSIKLVAMADIFQDRLNGSYAGLRRRFRDRVDVPPERRFIGFDAYRKAMDCLRPGDIVILTTPPAFRWVHLTYAIEKGLNVFLEKPVAVDAPSARRMIELAKKADEKNLKIGVGLMSRHSRALQELAKRIHDGELGQIILMRGYRVHGPAGSAFSGPNKTSWSDLLYQIRRFHSFLWASGGLYSDFYIHIIDHLCWMKGEWPVEAFGLGGRHYKTMSDGTPYIDQNFDVYSVEYTFADGTKMVMDGRCMSGCTDIYKSFVHGAKGMAIASNNGDCGLPSRIYRTQTPSREGLVWTSKVPPGESNPYHNEWVDLMDAIVHDKPYNEVKRGAMASLVTAMGRFSAHTGQRVTLEYMLNYKHEFAPNVDKLTMDSPPPVQKKPDGTYPKPMPGITRDREY